MKRRDAMLIFVKGIGLVSIASYWGCKNIFGPDFDNDDHIFRKYEILYERVLPILNPQNPDPTGDSFSTYHPRYGGNFSSRIIQIESNKWMAEILLKDDDVAYYICITDRKVFRLNIGDIIPSVAEKIFMRLKGETTWVWLKCIEDNRFQSGKWAKFIAHGGITNPCS